MKLRQKISSTNKGNFVLENVFETKTAKYHTITKNTEYKMCAVSSKKYLRTWLTTKCDGK